MHVVNNFATRFALVAAIIGGVNLPTLATAQTDEAIEATRHVNIAGRQRMLSQRISLAACLYRSGSNDVRYREMLSGAYSLFSASHNALINGDTEMGLSPEEIPSVLAIMGQVNERFDALSPLVSAVLDGDEGSAEMMIRLDASGLEFLTIMNKAVNRIASDYGEALEDLPLIHSITIDVAGRQRMLSQKSAKEFCLIDSGVDVVGNRENLLGTTTIFTNTLNALIHGFPGLVMPPPDAAVLAKLQEVEAAWLVPSSVLMRVANGGEITDTDRRIISGQIENVLVLMNQAVGMYELGN